MDVPEAWRLNDCSDYFQSSLAERGWWDAEGQYWNIEPAKRVHEDITREFLIIGGPGVDGIKWGYRRGHRGIWAHYPIDDDFVLLAESASDLQDGYRTGRITV